MGSKCPYSLDRSFSSACYRRSKYVVERVRRRLALEPPRARSRTVARLEPSEIERLIQTTYRY